MKRVARRFLLCVAAGEIAAEWGIVPWEQGESLQAVRSCFGAWLAVRGGIGAAEDTAIMERVMLFLEQHGQSRFQDAAKSDAVCINRVGFRQEEDGGTVYYILPESFKAEVCQGFAHRRAAEVLRDKGLLMPGDSGSFTRRPRNDLPGYGRKRCYAIFIKGGSDNAVVE